MFLYCPQRFRSSYTSPPVTVISITGVPQQKDHANTCKYITLMSTQHTHETNTPLRGRTFMNTHAHILENNSPLRGRKFTNAQQLLKHSLKGRLLLTVRTLICLIRMMVGRLVGYDVFRCECLLREALLLVLSLRSRDSSVMKGIRSKVSVLSRVPMRDLIQHFTFDL